MSWEKRGAEPFEQIFFTQVLDETGLELRLVGVHGYKSRVKRGAQQTQR